MTDAQLHEIGKRLAEPWYVVEAPWGDGTQVVTGNPDPHVGNFICDGGFVGSADDICSSSPEANAAAVVQTRDDAFALLLEVQRLRRRDAGDATAAANVLSSRHLQQIRSLMTAVKPVVKERYRQAILDLLVHVDAQASLIRTLYDLIGDLKDDLAGKGASAYERGRAEGTVLAMKEVKKLSAQWRGGGDVARLDTPAFLARLKERIGAAGNGHRLPVRPSEAEDGLRKCVDALDDYHEYGEGQYPGPVFDAIDAARPLLEIEKDS